MDVGGGGEDAFRRRLADRATSLSPALLKVARFIDANRALVVAGSASRLADRIGTSDATVVRSVQALGYRGFTEVREAFARSMDERPTPADGMRLTLAEMGEGVAEAIDQAFVAHAASLEGLRGSEDLASMAEAVSVLGRARRVAVFGIGPSAYVAGYMAFMLGRIGRRAIVLDASGRGLADRLLRLEEGDAAFMLAYGKPYEESKALASECRRRNIPLVVTSDARDAVIGRDADVVMAVPRGRHSRVALHAPTMLAVEALLLGLVSLDRARALHALDRLDELRTLVQPPRS